MLKKLWQKPWVTSFEQKLWVFKLRLQSPPLGWNEVAEMWTMWMLSEPKTYWEHCQASKVRHFLKLVNSFKPSTIFAKSSILDVWKDFKCCLWEPIIYSFLELLWVAPELIKDYKCFGKSKEGDVYSYGIILSEILSREDPYAEYEMEPQGKFRSFYSKNRLRALHCATSFEEYSLDRWFIYLLLTFS